MPVVISSLQDGHTHRGTYTSTCTHIHIHTHIRTCTHTQTHTHTPTSKTNIVLRNQACAGFLLTSN